MSDPSFGFAQLRPAGPKWVVLSEKYYRSAGKRIAGRCVLTIVRALIVKNANMHKPLSDNDILGLSRTLALELVYRLCLAECASLGFSNGYVTKLPEADSSAPGHVQVHLPAYVTATGFIPKPQTVFCVTASYIPLANIASHSINSDCIADFSADQSTGYVLASSRQALLETRSREYETRLRDCLMLENHADRGLDVDARFYSRNKLLNWSNKHPEIGAWLQDRYQSSKPTIFAKHNDRASNVIFSDRLQRLP